MATDLIARGALAVALTGSYARSRAGEYSDVDILALGTGTNLLKLISNHVISETWTDPGEVIEGFGQPDRAICSVPGWRASVILADPSGLAADLKRMAETWHWNPELNGKADSWVSRSLTGYCEEVFRLLSHVECGFEAAAAVMRNLLVNRLAGIMAVHRRRLYASENDLWDLMADEMGPNWKQLQRSALALNGELPSVSCQSALKLFGLAVDYAYPLFAEAERGVVDAAVGAIVKSRT